MMRSIRSIVTDELGIEASELSDSRPLAEFGMSSRAAVMIASRLEELSAGTPLPSTILWEHPTIEALATYLLNPSQKPDGTDVFSMPAGEPIAIVGMACRFPGAPHLEAFWELLLSGRDAITDVPPDRWDADELFAKEAGTPGRINNRRGGFIDGIDHFDAAFFGISPSEASVMDPQQRLLLECVWHAFEHAEMDARKLAGSDVGVFVGISTNDYQELQMADRLALNPYTGPGKSFSIAANRLSYVFDFRGPSMSIDTACSSSLVAVHQAVQSLRRRESSTAVAAGVNLLITPEMSIALSQAQMLSPDGRCKSFDEGANGYVRSEGVGSVVLKRLSDAQNDGDRIIAVIRGGAINQDGRSNGLTAPNASAQREVIQKALHDAGVAADQIGYVEAHGTGTALGDPIEVRSIQEVLGRGRPSERTCTIGSVKSNIGHLEAAAGMAGLIKTALVLSKGVIPTTAGFTSLNKQIHLQDTPFTIAVGTNPWAGPDRYAGVSSFGFGGANAHIVLEAPPVLESRAEGTDNSLWCVLPVSARTSPSFMNVVQEHITAIRQLDAAQLTDYCHAIATGRSSLPLRAAFMGRDANELIEAMRRHDGKLREAASDQSVWLFTGQGSQYTGMARVWYESIPAFRAKIDEFERLLGSYWTHSLRELLWNADRSSDLDQTQFTQAALFAIQMAMVETLHSWGLEPDAVAGYSVGEYTAACVAGIFSAEDGLKLLAERGRLVQAHGKPGSMMAVMANEEQCQELASNIDGLQIATINGSAGTVLAGTESALAMLAAHCEKSGIDHRRLNVSHAFHSALMEDVLEPFANVLSSVTFSKSSVPLVSNLTGLFEQGEMSDPKYWLRHLLEPVRFGDSMQTLFDHGFKTFLEMGPKPVLCGMASRFDGADGLNWIPIMRQNDDEERVLLDALGSLWSQGVDIEWSAIMPQRGKGTLQLPLYSFDRARYWLEPQKHQTKARGSAKAELVGTATHSKLIKGTLFASSLGVDTHPQFADHIVFDALVVPAAGHLALLMEATGKMWNDRPTLFEQVVFTKPLVLREHAPSELRLLIEDSGSFSLVDETSQYVPLASGIARIHSDASNNMTEALREVEQRCDREIIHSFYDTHWQKNIILGPAFRHITQVRVGQGELMASLSSDPIWEGQLDDLHPGLIDSMLQSLTVLVNTQDDEVTIPFTFEQVRYHRKSKGCIGYKSHVSLVESGEDRAVSNVRVWEVLHDGSSRMLLEIDRFTALKVKKKLLLQEMRSGSTLPAYELAWIPAEEAPAFDPVIDLPSDWKAYIDGNDLHKVATPVLGIGSVSRNHSQSTSAALADIALRLTHVATWCRSMNKPLVILTRGAYSIEETDGTDASHTAVAALVRQAERELLPGRLLHLDLPLTDPPYWADHSETSNIAISDANDRLLHLLQAGLPEVAWHAGQLWVPVFQSVTGTHQRREATPAISSAGRYLITGGSGALAKQVAIWLAERGAGQIDLLGRRDRSDELAQWLQTSFDDVNVRYTPVDITDRRQLQAELDLPDALPIKGIFHLAGTLNDRLLQDVTSEAFEQVLAPKVDGLVNLHNESLGLDLDHFVVFSSASSVLVTPGQGNYAMANAYMDGFIAERRRQGLPGVSLCWGPFASGMARGLENHFAKQGIHLLEEASIGALGGFLSEPTPAAVLIMDADWDNYGAINGSPSRIKGLVQRRDVRSAPVQSGFLAELKNASAEAKSVLVELEIRRQVALFLHKPDPKAIPARKRLFEMGLDSLGAVELKNRLAAALSRELRSTLLFDYPTIEDLVAHLTPLVLESNFKVSSSAALSAKGLNRLPSFSGETLSDLEDQPSSIGDDELNDMSEDELADLLRKELGDG